MYPKFQLELFQTRGGFKLEFVMISMCRRFNRSLKFNRSLMSNKCHKLMTKQWLLILLMNPNTFRGRGGVVFKGVGH
jgi:hypothetical protein